MALESLADFDFTAWSEPDPHLEPRAFFESWLDYQRHEFLRKLRDLDAEQLTTWSIPPVELSALGLVRHMTQMEHVWLTCGLGGGEPTLPYGEDDYAGGSVDTIDQDLAAHIAEAARADAVVATMPSLTSPGLGHGRSLQATLVKMIHEYTLHAGQAHMLRFAALGRMIR